MKAAVLAAAAVIAAAAAVVLWSGVLDGAPAPTPGGTPSNGKRPAAPVGFSPLVESDRQPIDLADAPTASVVVRDQASRQPVAGASVHRYQGGAVLGFTDEHGSCPLPLKKAEQLVIAADGYLLRLAPVDPERSTAGEPQDVTLLPDRYTLRCRFRFVGGDGEPVERVLVRFRPQAPAAGAGLRPPEPPAVQRGDAVLKRAWLEHCLIAGQPAFSQMRVQLGQQNSDRVHALRGDDRMLFCVPGLYELDAATEGGLVARAVFQAEAVVNEPLLVRLQPGGFVTGTVTGGGQPIVSAQVRARGGDPVGRTATTAVDGSFRLGPLPPGSVVLELLHPDFASTVTAPVTVGGAAAQLQMQPLPPASLRGSVRLQPRHTPIAGARVTAIDTLGATASTETTADGSFALRIGGGDTVRLNVSAPGCLPYSELLPPDGRHRDFDLWPAEPAARLAAGITGLLRGVVVDAKGHVVPGIPVRFYPDQPQVPAIAADRRVVIGAQLALPLVVTTGSDGSFTLETQHLGGGVLVPLDGQTQPEGGLRVQVTAGTDTSGLRVPAQERR